MLEGRYITSHVGRDMRQHVRHQARTCKDSGLPTHEKILLIKLPVQRSVPVPFAPS